jgi:hypothetical protein
VLEQDLQLGLEIILRVFFGRTFAKFIVEVGGVDFWALLAEIGEPADRGVSCASVGGEGCSDGTVRRHFNNKYYYTLAIRYY